MFDSFENNGRLLNLTHSVREYLKSHRDRLKELQISILEFLATSKNCEDSRRASLESKILVISHALEKGMGLREPRKGYGQGKALTLIEFLMKYNRRGYSQTAFAYVEGVKMLQAYFEFQERSGVTISNIQSSYAKLLKETCKESQELVARCKCGYLITDRRAALGTVDFDFERFVSSRHSMRDFEDLIVDKEVIKKAVHVANMAPSACNRQAIKVYCTSDRQEAKAVDNLITGTTGFKGVTPNFAIVSCDRAYFTGPEQFQWYINGGIYTSYLNLALHSLGVGSCIMQWFAFHKTESELKEHFGITKTEAIVAVVGFGYYPAEIKHICAQRRAAEDTIFYAGPGSSNAVARDSAQ